ncbi:MAG TPA: hypothetical protein VLS49_08400 [Usitatibacter sp.]|nr:hypothetical protein [Usitatibacter sp.]
MLLAGVWIGELAQIAYPAPALSAVVGAALAAFLLLALARASAHIRLLFTVVVALSAAMAW